MSTDPLTEKQDSLTNQDGMATDENSGAAKNTDQEVTNQLTDNTPDNLEASSDHSKSHDIPRGEIVGDKYGNSNNFDSNKNKEFNQQDEPSVSWQSGNNKVPANQLGDLDPLFRQDLDVRIEYIINKTGLNSLFEKNTQLEMKIESILQENAQLYLNLTRLTEENKQLRSEIVSLNDRLTKLEESEKFKFDALIQDALKQDDAVWDEDTKECQKHIEQAKLWHSKIEELYTSVSTAIFECSSRIDQCGDLMQELNKEISTLYKGLLNRYESLEISKRMLERLRDPIELLKKTILPSEQLLRLQEKDLVDLLRSQNDEVDAKKILDKKIKETGDTRYKSVREWRDLSEKLQRQWLSFIEKKLLPVLDSINDGKLHAEHLVADLKPGYQTENCQEKLSAWLKTYVDVENILLDSLKILDVNQMIVEHGQPIDYDRHEPLTTEPDPDLSYESIKEVTRNGYEYKLDSRIFILRSAQVIVVKN